MPNQTTSGTVLPLWTPSASQVASTNMARHMAEAGFDSFSQFHRWSVTEPGRFWRSTWDWFDVVGNPGSVDFAAPAPGEPMWQSRFLPDATLNVAENLLTQTGDEPALIFRGEDAALNRSISWDELRQLVGQIQAALAHAGIGPGDRVAAWLPNIVETYAVMLASAACGAVFSSTSPDFGVDGVVDRFGQIEPKILFAVDAYGYGGKVHDRSALLGEVIDGIASIETTVLVKFAGDGTVPVGCDAISFDEFIAPFGAHEPWFTPLPFDHPWYILFSSGTTGKPKSIVHRTGGLLLKHLVEQRLHCDVKPGDRLFYFTTPGWMMWNWLASGLASGATLILYDGSPFHRDGNRLFDLVDELEITFFGTSAKFIEALAKSDLRPIDTHRLSSIRSVASTGSALVAEGFEAVYDLISPNVHLASISGGTDLCGCLVLGDPTSPVYAGEIQRPALGLDIDVVDDQGEPAQPGQRGELVCKNAFPSMPLGFHNDPDNERFNNAYFARFPGQWHQGDFAEWTAHGGLIIHGRSDATLNPGGVRIGTAEIYRQVDKLNQISEAVVVGQQYGPDTRIVLFVVLRPGVALDEALVSTIKSTIRSGTTARHVPAVIGQVADIPRTRSGKIAELAVRSIIQGEPIKNTEALANPESLEHYRDHPALK